MVSNKDKRHTEVWGADPHSSELFLGSRVPRVVPRGNGSPRGPEGCGALISLTSISMSSSMAPVALPSGSYVAPERTLAEGCVWLTVRVTP